jgi:citrate lyase subunit beta/citryl-CoA lyase
MVALVQEGVDGIVLPKLETADEIRACDWLVTNLERERGLPQGSIDVIPIVETGKGLANIRAICAAGTRVKRVAFGAGDFTLDMNMTWTRDETELLPYRTECVLASRAGGIEPPVDTVWVDIKDVDGFRRSVQTIKGLGFQGKMCIYPDQVTIVNEMLSPTEAEVAWSKKVVAAFAEAETTGSASIQLDGKFIDYPIVYRAERVIAMAERIAAKAKG